MAFQKGKSGNPTGRPKGLSLAKILQDVLNEKPGASVSTYRELVVRKLVVEAIKGDMKAQAIIWDRLEGKIPSASVGLGFGKDQDGNPTGEIPDTVTVTFTA